MRTWVSGYGQASDKRLASALADRGFAIASDSSERASDHGSPSRIRFWRFLFGIFFFSILHSASDFVWLLFDLLGGCLAHRLKVFFEIPIFNLFFLHITF